MTFLCSTCAESMLWSGLDICIAVAHRGGQGRRLYGALFVKEASTHFCRPLSFHSFVRPAPQAFSLPDRIFASPSRTAAVKDGASVPPPEACPFLTRARRQAAVNLIAAPPPHTLR